MIFNSSEVIKMRFKALLFGLILLPSAAFADTVVCRGGGCPPEATNVGLSTGITKAIAGPNISLNPVSGIGEVTITSLGGSQGSAGDSISSATMTRVSGGLTNSYQINGDTKAFQTATQFVVTSSLQVTNTITSTNPIAAPVPTSFVQPGALGANVMVSSVAAQSVNGDSLKSTNKATDGLVPKFDAATGGVTWSADNAGGGGSGGGTTSSTMVVVGGDTDATGENAVSVQVGGGTKGWVNGNGALFWGTPSGRHISMSSYPAVGIGTDQPIAPLHIIANVADVNANNVYAMFNNGDMTNPKMYIKAPGSTSGSSRLVFGASGTGASESVTMQYDYSVIGTQYQLFRIGVGANPELGVFRDSGRFGVGISTPNARVHISTDAGSGGPILIVSTGTSNLFEVNGTSIVAKVQLFSPDGSPYSTTSVQGGGGPEADTLALSQVGRLVSTNTVGITWIELTSATIRGELAVAGGGAVIKSTQAVIKFLATDTSDTDFEVAETSVSISVGGTMVKLSTDQVNTVRTVDNMTFDATSAGNVLITTISYGLPGPVYFSSMVVVQTTATAGGFGEGIFTHNDTTATNKVTLRAFQIRTNNPGQEFTFHFVEFATGTVRGNRHYVMTIATASTNGGGYSTITMKLPIAFTVTAPIDGPGTTMTDVTTTGWSNLVGPGGCLVFIGIGRDNGISHTLDTSENPTLTGPYAMTGGFRE